MMFVWSTVAAISNREEEGIGIDDQFIHSYIHTFTPLYFITLVHWTKKMRLKARYGITRSTGIFITIFLRIDVANGELLYNSGYSGSGGSQLPTYYRYRIIKPVISKIFQKKTA